jgi:hypothetical protein
LPQCTDDAPPTVSPGTDLSPVSTLPSGRSVCVTTDDQREQIEVRSPQGEVEVRIVMTEDGPVLSLRGARLEIDSTDSVALRCKRFEVQASEGIALQGGDVDVRSTGDIHTQSTGQTFIDGDYVNLNCLERTGYHDEGQSCTQEEYDALAAQAKEANDIIAALPDNNSSSNLPPPDGQSCGCDH